MTAFYVINVHFEIKKQEIIFVHFLYCLFLAKTSYLQKLAGQNVRWLKRPPTIIIRCK